MLSYSWPGNVRELQNSLERAVALATFDHLRLEDLPERMRAPTPMAAVTEASDPEELITATELERRYIAHVLATVKGNKTAAARILGLDRRTIYRKMTQRSAACASLSAAATARGACVVGERARAVDQRHMREGLREVADQPSPGHVVLLGEQPHVVAEGDQALEERRSIGRRDP